VIENGASETIHFCVAARAGPAAEEKLTKVAWHTEFWLSHIATWAIHSVPINRNGRFRSVCHTSYVGGRQLLVKAQDDATLRRSY